jgi:uncharacterized membrane protein (UPF0127 family)
MIRSALVALALATVVLTGGCNADDGATSERVVIKGEAFDLEIARDPGARETGLMHREAVPPGTGMVFVFPDAQVRRFWMANCLVDIDIMFLDGRGRITATHRMRVEPPQREDETDSRYLARLRGYSSRYPSQFAIELPAGSLDRLGLQIEEQIGLDLDRLRELAQ